MQTHSSKRQPSTQFALRDLLAVDCVAIGQPSLCSKRPAGQLSLAFALSSQAEKEKRKAMDAAIAAAAAEYQQGTKKQAARAAPKAVETFKPVSALSIPS